MRGLLASGLAVGCALGCTTGSFDLDENLGVQGEWTPEFAIPLGSATVGLGDLEAWLDSDDFILGATGTEFVYVRSIPLFDLGADDLVAWNPETANIQHSLTAQEAAALNAAPDGFPVAVSFEAPFSLQGPGSCALETAVFAGGSIEMTSNAAGPIGGSVAVVLPAFLVNGSPLEITCPLGDTVQVPLDGCVWNGGNSASAAFTFSAVPGPGNSQPGDAISIQFSLDPSGWATLTGACPGLTSQDFEGSYTVDLYANRPGQTLHVADPRIYLTIENEQGIGAQLTLESLAVSTEAGTLEIGGAGVDAIPPLGPALPWGTVLVWTHSLTNANTSPTLSAVWNASTGTVNYAGNIGWVDAPGVPEALLRAGRVRGTATLEFPFNGYAAGFVLRDTLQSDIAGALRDAVPDPLTWDDVERITVRVAVANGLPVGGTLEAFFADSTGTPLESVFGAEAQVDLVPGTVDFTLPDGHPDAGKVVAEGRSVWDVHLDGTTAAFLVEAGCDRIVMRVEATSEGAAAQRNVRFFPESQITLALAARVDLNLVP